MDLHPHSDHFGVLDDPSFLATYRPLTAEERECAGRAVAAVVARNQSCADCLWWSFQLRYQLSHAADPFSEALEAVR